MISQRTILEPAREIPVAADVEVLVVGGGPAGIAAGIAAAREGARTLLVERYGYLGGMITGANVTLFMGMGDGEKLLARGLCQDIYDRLGAMGAVSQREGDTDFRVDNETFKWQAQEMLLEAGADLLLQTQVCAPIMEGNRVVGVYTESKSGRQALLAQVVVDCSADADVAFRAGCACDDEAHVVTLVARTEGVDRERVAAFAREHPAEHAAIMTEAKRLNGDTTVGAPRYLADINVANAADLTRAEIQLRREAFETLRYLRANLPGYERATLTTYPQFGVRQGRRIKGVRTLTEDDMVNSRHSPEGIARLGVYFPDWGPTYQLKGLAYDIPYGCLVPQEVDGLLVGGRCIAADYRTANTMRLIVPCVATGQAAGAAAGVAVEVGCGPRAVPTETLRQALRQQDVFLGEE
jgi:ribulose 1,5-bisphosphate synthetase/thiazole synthase